MRAVIQRVSRASVTADGVLTASIGTGLLVLLGIEDADTPQDIEWLSGKIVRMRIFNDENGVMNRSVQDVGGDIIVVSQFTLHASTVKGNRPSYIRAAHRQTAIPLYEAFPAKDRRRPGTPGRSRGVRSGHESRPAQRRPGHHPHRYQGPRMTRASTRDTSRAWV